MKKFIVFLATTLILSALGFGAFTFIQNIHLFEVFSEKFILTQPVLKKNLYELKYSDSELPFDILEYPYEYPSSKKDKPKYFFGDKKRIGPLIQKFKDEVNYGPEIMGLRSISINNSALFKLGSSGTYYPGTNQINLQTKKFPKELLNDNNLKIQWIHEILAHEYAHHLFYIYVSSPHPLKEDWKDPLLDYGINQKEAKANYVNKVFLKKFKDIFNYNSNVLIPQYSFLNSWKLKKKKTLSSMYSLEELFNFANKRHKINKKASLPNIWPLSFSKNDLVSKKNFWEDLIINFDKYNIRLSKIQDLKIWKIISTKWEKIKYYYSLSELLARKFTLSTIPWSKIDTEMLSSQADKKFILILEEDRQRVSNRFSLNKKILYIDFFQDNPFRPLNISFNKKDYQQFKKYKRKLELLRRNWYFSGNLSNSNLIYESRLRNFLLQKIEKASSKEPKRQIVDAFMELILDFMGANNNSNISVMFPKNRWRIEKKLLSNGKSASVILKYPEENIDPNEITLGGFLTEKQKNKLGPLGPYNICFQDKNSNKIIKYPITIQKKIYKKKKFLEGKANTIFSKYIWFLKSNNYLSAEKIKGKKIFLQSDNKEQVYFKTFRGEDLNKSGFTSSWLRNYPKTNLEKFTHYVYQPLISKENLVEIKRGPLYHTGYSPGQ